MVQTIILVPQGNDRDGRDGIYLGNLSHLESLESAKGLEASDSKAPVQARWLLPAPPPPSLAALAAFS